MNAKDLMIDDWVFSSCAGKNVQIIEIKKDCVESSKNLRITTDENIIIEPYDNISPIQLTFEILKKNGFLEDSNGIFYLKENIKFGIKKDIDYGYWFTNRVDNYKEYICTCDFVHELQHLLKLCKIEKRIVL